jgi:hypothetical protein
MVFAKAVFQVLSFRVCLHDLISRITEVTMGCFIGRIYVVVFVNADDMPRVSCTPLAKRKMLDKCDRYAKEYRKT